MSRADTVHCFCSFRKVSEFRKKTMNCERLNCFAICVCCTPLLFRKNKQIKY